MSQFFKTFDLWDPTCEDFLYETQARVNEIRQRWVDNHTWGIIRDNAYLAVVNIPVSAMNQAPNRKWNILQFPISLNVATGEFSIGAGSSSSSNPAVIGGAAYDLNGERIAIIDDLAFDFSNDSPYGKKSSGNLSIPLTLGNSGPAVPGTYYVWVEALDVNLPIPVVSEDGVTHYPEITDGYRILMTADPVAPSGDGVSIFVCKIIWVGGSGTLFFPGNTSATNANDTVNFIDSAPSLAGDPHRIFSALRDNCVEIVVDNTNKTLVYGQAFVGSLRDHINAIGAGTPTANNPHGLALSDIPGAGEEPVATFNQEDSFDKGIVDKNAPQNSPARNGDALQPFIEVTGLTPTTLDPAATSAGITSTPKVQWVRIKDLDNIAKTKAAFVSGFRLKRLYPNLRQTNFSSDPSIDPADPETGDGWIGFNNTEDTPGVYRLFGTKVTLSDGNDVLMLNKELLAGWPSAILALSESKLLIGQVYWDGVTVFRNPVEPSTSDPVASQPDDQRSLGLVGPQQISTEAKSDPVTGALAAQVFENQVFNSNYAQGIVNVTTVNIAPGGALGFSSAVTVGSDASIAQPPVGATTGYRWTTNAGSVGSLGPSYVYHALNNLKPGRFYGISFFYKANSSFNDRLRIGLADAATNTPNSLITIDGVSSVDPLDLTILNDNQWHRGALVVQTIPGLNPDQAIAKYLEFLFEQGGVASTVGQISITNIQVTEGEWIPGYAPEPSLANGQLLSFEGTTPTNPPTSYPFDGAAWTLLDENFDTGFNIADIFCSVSGEHIAQANGGPGFLQSTMVMTVELDSVEIERSTQVHFSDNTIGGGENIGTTLFAAFRSLVQLSPGTHNVKIKLQTTSIGTITSLTHVNQSKARIMLT